MAYKQGKVEMEMFRKFWNNKLPSTDTLIDYLFGENSQLYHLLSEELHLSYEDYCRFMATFYTASEFKVPAT